MKPPARLTIDIQRRDEEAKATRTNQKRLTSNRGDGGGA